MTLSAKMAYDADVSFDYADQTVLITGASSGIGAEFATMLAERGASLVLVARRFDRLTDLAAKLHRAQGISVCVIAADLTSPTAATDLRETIENRGIRITSLINNAGFGTFGAFVGEDLARLTDEIAVDITAPVSLTHVFLPDLLENGHGFVINVASMAAYTPAPRMAVYAAAKAFVLSFTEALWAETRGSGVAVFALSPGATSTEFNAVVGTEDATAGATMRTPMDVVSTALKHLDRRNPGPSVVDGPTNRIGAAVSRLPSRRMSVTMMNRLTDPERRTR
jgi:short-subunit dehydrogenase